MYRLLATHGSEVQYYALSDSDVCLGSAPENDFVVSARGVSRRHAMVQRRSAGVEVIDLGSKNGLLVAGRRVEHTILTPGLRLQIGVVWLEVEEASSSQVALDLLLQSSSGQLPLLPPQTPIVQARADNERHSPADAALRLAYHIAQVGVGLPGGRPDLLARIRATLGAEALASFERTRRGALRVLECEARFSSKDIKLVRGLVENVRSAHCKQVLHKRAGRLLLAGRQPWFLGAAFADEALAQEGWRRDFLRFVAHHFFAPVRELDNLKAVEAARVLALARGNKRRAAALLGISPGTFYKLLDRRRSPKS